MLASAETIDPLLCVLLWVYFVAWTQMCRLSLTLFTIIEPLTFNYTASTQPDVGFRWNDRHFTLWHEYDCVISLSLSLSTIGEPLTLNDR
jgi:hypothetical protein